MPGTGAWAAESDALALAAQGGSRPAFEALVVRLQEPLFNFLRLRARCAEDAEELTQETFLRAWQRIERYDPRWRVSTWLFTIGRRLLVSRYRLRRESPAREGDGESDRAGGDLADPSPALDPARAASEREERENLWDVARQVLSREQHCALWLRYAEDLSTRQIGRVLGRREVTVRVLLFRARARLAPHLEPPREEGHPPGQPVPSPSPSPPPSPPSVPSPEPLAEARP